MLNKIKEFMPIGEHNFDQDDVCKSIGYHNWAQLREVLIVSVDEDLLVKDQLTHNAMKQNK